MMDPHETSPVATGLRELREETGYEGDHAQLIGQVFPNPAIMSNTCFTVLVDKCHLRHETNFDHGEDIIVKLVNIADVPELVATGKIRHSLVVVALFHFELWQQRRDGKQGQLG